MFRRNDGDARTTFAVHSLAACLRSRRRCRRASCSAHAARVAAADHRAVREQPSIAISSTRSTPDFDAGRILDRRRLVSDRDLNDSRSCILPHLAAERDRERTVAQHDDRRRATELALGVRAAQNEYANASGIRSCIVASPLTMTSLQHSRPIRPSMALPWILRAPGRRKPREREYHRAGETANRPRGASCRRVVLRSVM